MLLGDSDSSGTFRQQLMAALADPEVVNLLHQYSDYDTIPDGLHHQLGLRHDQSSYGDHNHDGSNSSAITRQLQVIAEQQASQTIPNGGWTRVQCISNPGSPIVAYDPFNLWDNTNFGLNIPVSGSWLLTATVAWVTFSAAEQSGLGRVYAAFASDSANDRLPGRTHQIPDSGDGNEINLAIVRRLGAGVFTGLLVFQSVGSSHNTRAGNFDVVTSMSAYYLGP